MSELRGFKFVTALLLELKEIESHDATKYSTFYWNSKVETTINGSNIDNAFKSVYSAIISNIQKSLGKGLGCIIDLALDHIIVISKKQPLTWQQLYQITKRVRQYKKSLVNIQIVHDTECRR